ncbi:MAG: phosphatidylserine decarboxylase [Deltaproteobacteria bacterium]|nr:phosphatidylserine decarboxylase [Deltaproteobacteria bacterium]
MAMTPPPPKWLDLLATPQVSQTMGKLVGARAPKPILKAAIRTFARAYKVDLDEAAEPIESFDTFQAFFTRKLKAGARPVEQAADVLPSPADGVLSAFGTLESSTLIQAKGVEYTLDALLGGSDDADPYRNGCYAVVYLAPNNYHRVHTPWRGTVARWRYLPGALYPVNQMGLRHVHGLFARNERIVGHCETEFGPAALVMVGATCVGHMRVAFTDLACNEGHPGSGLRPCAPLLATERGDEFGVFEMGSTVVLVMQRRDLRPALAVPSPIRMGEAMLRAADA